MKLFTAFAALALITAPVQAAEYKVRLSGGSAYWGGQPSFAVVKTNDTNKVTIYQTTNTVDQFFGTGKWWDHKVTASRACIVDESGWSNKEDCVIGEGGVIQLADDANVKDYSYQIKWKEGGTVRQAEFGIE